MNFDDGDPEIWWVAPEAFHDFWCQVAIAALISALELVDDYGTFDDLWAEPLA